MVFTSVTLCLVFTLACRPAEENGQSDSKVNYCSSSVIDCLWTKHIHPSYGTPLTRNMGYTFTAELDYLLQSNSTGYIEMIFTDQDFVSVSGSPTPRVDVRQGLGSTSISSSLALSAPSVTSIHVVIYLYGTAATMSSLGWSIGPYPVR